MTGRRANDNWAAGDAYDAYMGRWSRLVGRAFLDWLAEPPDLRWLEIGCGTGVLSEVILEYGEPKHLLGIDPSESFLAHARERTPHPALRFRVGSAEALPVEDGQFDVAVSGLVLNFLADPARAVMEMRRAVHPGGTVAAYVWDYGEGMDMVRLFWEAATALDPAAREHDEGVRFPLAAEAPLAALFRDSGLEEVETRAIEVPTIFDDFDDYWSPFLAGVGPAPAYCMGLDETARTALRERLQSTLPVAPDGRIHLNARAWAVRGDVPG
ncbi:MAG: class I SAM-dependent methyltransferase [Alphaproteobacteria bacterium]|nr:MAG: class I SAM-dependent methyltransferase [Alphaproteobacteria bacterium]